MSLFTSFQQNNCSETFHNLHVMPEDTTTLIIGSACGAVLVVILVISVFVLCLRRMEVKLSRKAVSQFVVPKSKLREDNIEGRRGILHNLPMKCILPGMISDFEEAVNLGKTFSFPDSIYHKTGSLFSRVSIDLILLMEKCKVLIEDYVPDLLSTIPENHLEFRFS